MASSETATPPAPARQGFFLKQPNMLRVLYALAPILVAGIYFFGWRVLLLVALSAVAGLAVERLMTYNRRTRVSMACLVTCCLYALSLPPTMPVWMAMVGAGVAILFGKEVFGGFGRNFANPAIVGRAFVYVCFPIEATGRFAPVYRGFPGGFAQWWPEGVRSVPEWLASASGSEVLSSATPMLARRDMGFETPTSQLLFGNIGGVFKSEFGNQVLSAGSAGEVCALLIILSGVYLLVTKTANWRLTISVLGGALVMNALARNVFGVEAAPPAAFTFASGALLYGAFFMVTDPVSAPKKKPAMFAYGAFIGAMIVFLRWKAQFSGAVAFAILLGNMVGPLLDMAVAAREKKRKSAATARETA